jgi:hypothetical protein
MRPALDVSRLGACLARAFGLMAFWFVISWAPDAHGYPWLIKSGFAKCSTCHVDPSGGETLTHMGRVQADVLLSTRGDNEDPRDFTKFLYGLGDPDRVRLGGSLRGAALFRKDNNRIFPMQVDAYGAAYIGDIILGGSIGVVRVDPGSPHARRAQLTTSQERDLTLLSRNHYAGVELSDALLLRAGRLNIPFGLRIPEHTMWIRETTRTDRESDQLHGISLAVNDGRWRSEVMAIFGNFQINPDEYRERGYSGYVEYLVNPTFALGLSSLYTQARRDVVESRLGRYSRNAHGVMGRLGLGNYVGVMGEFDVLKNTGSDFGYVGFVQGNVEPIQGLQLTAVGEVQDRGSPDSGAQVKGAGEPQFGAWFGVNWFFLTHFDVRADVIIRQETDPTLFLQAHTYF